MYSLSYQNTAMRAVDKSNILFFAGVAAWLFGSFGLFALSNVILPEVLSVIGLVCLVVGPIYWFFFPDYITNQIYRTEKEQDEIAARAAAEQRKRERLRCPHCKSMQTSVTKSDLISFETTETRVRRIDHYSRDDTFTGYFETEYEVPVTLLKRQEQAACSQCQHVWTLWA